YWPVTPVVAGSSPVHRAKFQTVSVIDTVYFFVDVISIQQTKSSLHLLSKSLIWVYSGLNLN
ncbi:hypothetical protein QG034_08500, partial [Kingella kingae]|uniref:hypothetical protein n=1 Tax=Kingella kingae TaxID=504 RepID=UPI00254E72F8